METKNFKERNEGKITCSVFNLLHFETIAIKYE